MPSLNADKKHSVDFNVFVLIAAAFYNEIMSLAMAFGNITALLHLRQVFAPFTGRPTGHPLHLANCIDKYNNYDIASDYSCRVLAALCRMRLLLEISHFRLAQGFSDDR